MFSAVASGVSPAPRCERGDFERYLGFLDLQYPPQIYAADSALESFEADGWETELCWREVLVVALPPRGFCSDVVVTEVSEEVPELAECDEEVVSPAFPGFPSSPESACGSSAVRFLDFGTGSSGPFLDISAILVL